MVVGTHDDLAEAIEYIDPTGCTYDEWLMVGMSLHESGLPCDVWDMWSARDPDRYNPGECARKWASFGRYGSQPVRSGSLIRLAERGGFAQRHSAPDEAFGWDDDVIVDPAFVDSIELPDRVNGRGSWDPRRELVDYLRVMFEETEHVCYVTQSWIGDDGKYHPKKGYWDRTAGELISELETADSVADVLGDWDRDCGVWVCHNPVDGQGRTIDNVTSFRHVLIESDKDDLGKQLAIMQALNLPLTAVVSSGGKSIHGLVRVDATDKDDYRTRVNRVYEECQRAGMRLDTQNRNASRLSRLPGVTRGGKRQALIATNIGARSYEEWVDWVIAERDDLPDATNLAAALSDLPSLAEPLIEGILRRGHKMLVAGPSKAGKSFALMELAVAVAEGGMWLGHPCHQGKVLYVNLEIDAASCMHRFAAIYEAMGLVPDRAANVDVWNLRGKACPMDRLAPRLIHRAAKKGRDPEHGGYSLVIIDPIYKILTGDENSAADMGAFCNEFDKVCAELGCSVVYCHHHSKGYQGAKHSMDRMSGSGVFARDPDAILDMTPTDASAAQRKACRDSFAISLIDQRLSAKGFDVGRFARKDVATYAAQAYEAIGRDEGGVLNNDLLAVLDGSDHISTWRITYTLREFKGIESTDCWFDYPLHVPDHKGVLADCPYVDGSPGGNNGQRRSRRKGAETDAGKGADKCGGRPRKELDVVEAYEQVGAFCGGVSVADMAEYMGVSERTVRRRIRDTGAYELEKGMVVPVDSV